eukprot:97526_1
MKINDEELDRKGIKKKNQNATKVSKVERKGINKKGINFENKNVNNDAPIAFDVNNNDNTDEFKHDIQYSFELASDIDEFDDEKEPVLCIGKSIVAELSVLEQKIEFSDLDFVDKDIDNLKLLFENDLLNYTVKVKPGKDIENPYKIRWNGDEINDYIDEMAKEFENEEGGYDALFIVFTCHGINNNIITSDIKKIDHTQITRKFKPHQNKPRIFVFDCCSGSNAPEPLRSEKSRGTFERMDSNELQDLEINMSSDNKPLFEELSPDFKQVTIKAATQDFVAIGTNHGSFLTKEFTDLTKQYIENGNNQYLHDILSQVQNKLHE